MGPPRRDSCLALNILALNLTPERLMQCPICSLNAATPSDHRGGALLSPLLVPLYVLTHVSFFKLPIYYYYYYFALKNFRRKLVQNELSERMDIFCLCTRAEMISFPHLVFTPFPSTHKHVHPYSPHSVFPINTLAASSKNIDNLLNSSLL